MGLTLYIVRHGNTFEAGETPRRIGARTDIPLVESGREQARALGRWFLEQGVRFDEALTSPLSRTRETAELILAPQDDAPPMEPADWLAEIDHGPDEGLCEQAVVDRIGSDALKAWETRGSAPPGWQVNAAARCAAWRGLFDRNEARERTHLLVTSNGAARFALLAHPHLWATAQALPSLKLRTGSYGRITLIGDAPRLDAWDVRPGSQPASLPLQAAAEYRKGRP